MIKNLAQKRYLGILMAILLFLKHSKKSLYVIKVKGLKIVVENCFIFRVS
jgi:hypothetical protein